MVNSAVSLAQLLRDQGSPPATKVSAGPFGMIHLEWYKSKMTVVITLLQPGEAEVITYSNEGTFGVNVFHFESMRPGGIDQFTHSLKDDC